jgi:hypothetical protein
MRRLRYERGLIYSLSASNSPPNRDDFNLVFTAECTDANVDAVQKGLLEVLHEIAAEGQSEEERAHWLLTMETAAADPNEAASMAYSYAEDELLGIARSNETMLAEMHAVSRSDAATALRAAMDHALLLIPEEDAEPPPPPFKEFESAAPTMKLSGKRFPLKGLKGRLKREGCAVLGDVGVAWQKPDGEQAGVFFEECEALMTWADGAVQLIDANGTWFGVETSTLRGGDELKASLLRSVPANRVIPMD